MHVGPRAFAAPWGVVAVGDAGEVHFGRPVDVLFQLGVEARVAVLVPREVVQVDGQGAAVLLEVVGDAADAGVSGYGFYDGMLVTAYARGAGYIRQHVFDLSGGPARPLQAFPPHRRASR